LELTPGPSIALDGYVNDAPNFSEKTKHINFDHHHGVVREATMATAEQVYMAVKGGLFKSFRENGKPFANVYINDCDQDTCLAIFILDNYEMFEGISSHPAFNRLLALDSKLDITGGAFPMNLNEKVLAQHHWVFEPYTNLRKSGALAEANAEVMADCVESVCNRIMRHIMGTGGTAEMDIRHEILFQSQIMPEFKIVNEIGGSSARYYLFSHGAMDAFVSLVAKRPDGKYVYSIGRKSRYIPFPVQDFFVLLNDREGLTRQNGWGGSDIIGGSSRELGSSLEPGEIFELIETYLRTQNENRGQA
jgi:hypothetical protein